jgi:hypothetical protein
MNVESHIVIILQEKTEEIGVKACPSATLSTTNSTLTDPGAKQDLCGERPNLLSIITIVGEKYARDDFLYDLYNFIQSWFCLCPESMYFFLYTVFKQFVLFTSTVRECLS